MTNPEGVLHVNVVQAKKLHGEDFIGKNDPYVELYLDSNYKQTTKTINNTNDPVWNQAFTFPMTAKSSFHKIYFLVKDKDVVGSDEIGKAHIDFTDVLKGQRREIDEWVTLKSGLHIRSKGELQVRITFVPH